MLEQKIIDWAETQLKTKATVTKEEYGDQNPQIPLK